MPHSIIKDVNCIKLTDKDDHDKVFKILCDDDKVHLSAPLFSKTVVDNLFIDHEGTHTHVSSHLYQIQDSVVDESTRAINAEAVLKEDLDTQVTVEREIRLTKDADLQTQVSDNKTASEASIVATQTVLTNLIQTETDRAIAKEAEISDSVVDEKARAEVAERLLDDKIEAESARASTSESIITASVNTEKNRALLVEAGLQESLVAEIAERMAKDADLDLADAHTDQSLTDEVARAISAEQTENTRARDAEESLSTALAVEVNRAQEKEDQLEQTLNNVISNIDPASLDSLTEIVSKINDVDASAFNRIHTIEEYLKKVFCLESLYPLTVTDMAQLIFDIATHGSIFPDEQAPFSCDNGWGFKNDAVDSKINWYFVQNLEDKTLEDYSGLYAKVKLESVDSLPFFNIYTKPKGDGTDASSWYGSRRTYVFSEHHNLVAGDECMMYYGADLPATYPDVPHVQLVLDQGSSNGSDSDTQELLTVAFATNSGAVLNAVDLCAKAFIVGDGTHTHITLSSTEEEGESS